MGQDGNDMKDGKVTGAVDFRGEHIKQNPTKKDPLDL